MTARGFMADLFPVLCELNFRRLVVLFCLLFVLFDLSRLTICWIYSMLIWYILIFEEKKSKQSSNNDLLDPMQWLWGPLRLTHTLTVWVTQTAHTLSDISMFCKLAKSPCLKYIWWWSLSSKSGNVSRKIKILEAFLRENISFFSLKDVSALLIFK